MEGKKIALVLNKLDMALEETYNLYINIMKTRENEELFGSNFKVFEGSSLSNELGQSIVNWVLSY